MRLRIGGVPPRRPRLRRAGAPDRGVLDPQCRRSWLSGGGPRPGAPLRAGQARRSGSGARRDLRGGRHPPGARAPRRQRDRVLGRHHPRQRPDRHRRRPRRQPLVHRARREPDRAHHPRRRRHRVLGRHHRRQRPVRASPPAPTATSGSPSADGDRDRAHHPGRRRSPSSRRHHRRQRSPSGIAAGPDGNLWFTECERQPDRAHHARRRRHRVLAGITAASARRASRPAPTATSGSPS